MGNNSLWKKILVYMMTFMMVFSTMPTGVFAADENDAKTNEAQIGPHYEVDSSGNLPGTPSNDLDLGADTSHHYGVNESEGKAEEGGSYDDVVVDKTISATGEENKFKIDLTVTTKQRIEEPDMAVALVVDVSTSMDAWYNSTNTQTRIQAAQESMKKFVEDFGNVVSDTTKREIAITKFCVDAETVTEWVDVTTEAGRQKVYDYIDTLHYGVGTQSGSTAQNSGTNIEGGLLLGRNLVAKQSIEDKHVILLSDGGANSCVLDINEKGFVAHDVEKPVYYSENDLLTRDSFEGSWYYADYHFYHGGAEEAAESIQKLDVKLHTVYCGNTEDKLTVGDPAAEGLLSGGSDCDYCKAANAAFDANNNSLDYLVTGFLEEISDDFVAATNSEDLLGNILKIAKEIGEAWVVTDPIPMGNHIEFIGFEEDGNSYIYDQKLGAISWDLKSVSSEDIESTTVGGVTTYTYTVSYFVRLDNVYEGFKEDIWHNTNNTTSVPYVISRTTIADNEENTITYAGTAYFNVPSVTGYTAELTFEKVKYGQVAEGSEEIDPLAGAVFAIKHSDDCDCGITLDDPNWEMTATTNGDGDIEFSNIPSGHTYTMTEKSAPDTYKASEGEYKFSVAYGTINKISDTLFDENNQIVNEKIETVTINGTKTWEGDSSYQRPSSVTINLYANGVPAHDESGNAIKATVSSSTDWKYEFTNLPRVDEDGSLIEYTIIESPVENYYPSYEGYDVKNTYSTNKNITVQKLWDDVNNQDGLRPESIEIELKATYVDRYNRTQTVDINKSFKIDPTIELNENNGWIHTFTDLPETITVGSGPNKRTYNVTYDVTENYSGTFYETDGGYDSETNFAIFVNRHTPETTSISGTKSWNDDDNAEGKRPSSIVVNLYKTVGDSEAEFVDSKTITGEGNVWNYSFTDLPKYQNGTLIDYHVNEQNIPGYSLTVEGNNLTNTPVNDFGFVTSYTGTKNWVNDDSYVRPDSLTVELYKDNNNNFKIDEGDEVISSEPSWSKDDDTWTYTFDDLPVFNDDGSPIEYMAKEVLPTSKIPDAGEYDGEEDGVRTSYVYEENQPEFIIETPCSVVDFELPKNEQDLFFIAAKLTKNEGTLVWTPRTATDNEKQQIEHRIPTNLQNSNYIYITGSPMSYTNLSGSTVTFEIKEVTDDSGNKKQVVRLTFTKSSDWSLWGRSVLDYSYTPGTTTFTNTFIPKLTEATVTKVWEDDENRDGIRPDNLEVTLSNGTVVTLNEGNNWTASVKELPKYSNGKEIEYTWTEANVTGYDLISSSTEGAITTLKNKHIPETISVSGTKSWNDNNNQDGIRPTSIVIELLADGTKVTEQTVRPDDNGDWTYIFENLPEYKDGKKINYLVAEKAVAGYETEITGYNITNKRVPETTEITGTKTWDDNNNEYKNRPESITINLLANGKEISDTEVSSANNWTYKFENLPIYNNGVEIKYTITEDSVFAYETIVKDNNITNTLKTTSVAGSKVWNDNDNQDGIRPQAVTVELTGTISDGVVYTDSQDVTAATNWNWFFNELPKYVNGKEVTYEVTESAVTGYTSVISNDEDGKVTITNTHTPEKISISGTKTWVDNDNQDGMRPESIEVILQKNGEIFERKTVTAEDKWEYVFNGLDKFENGKLINYSIAEITIPKYTTTYNGYNITNKHAPEHTSVTVSKEWDDNNNQDGIRTNEVKVNLLANNVDTGRSIILNEGNNWSGSFTELDVMANGQVIDYSVTEDEVAGYVATITEVEEGSNVFTVKNTHTPEVKDISGIKEWDDNNNQDGMRPSSININLLANGRVVATQEVTAKNNWAWNFEDMPVKADGTEIVYTITETISDDYYASVITGTSGIKNTHNPEKTTVRVVKSWQDDNNVDGIRPARVDVQLKADGNVVDTVELNANNNWEYNFIGLDKYKDGKEIVYTVNEKSVPTGYTAQVNETSNHEFSIANIHEPETLNITGSKEWDDNDDQDGERPESLTIKLFADGSLYAEKTVKASDGWNWEFNNLPKYKKGKVGEEIQYAITEVTIDGYSTTYEVSNDKLTQNVVNEHTPEETSITVTKAWHDDNNQDGLRPEEITVNLLADGNKTDKTLVLKDSDGWKGTFKNLPKYRDGGETIEYTISEVKVEGYKTVISGTAEDGFLVSNSHDPETVAVSGHKVWDDENNRDGLRPELITVNVWNGEIKVASKEVAPDEDGNWNWEFTDLPKYQKGGDEIEYYFTEEEVYGYDSAVEKNVITNTHVPETVVIKGEKSWDDNNDQDGLRPDGIIIYIMDGETIVETLSATAEDNWKYESSALPKYRTGKVGEAIKYTVKEVAVDGYKATYSTNGYDITNTHIPETTAVEGIKTWDDNDNQDGKRPESITVNLWANGEKIKEATVTARDNWEYKFTNLPKYEAGEEITYQITESAVTDYSTTYDGYNITNSYTPGQTSITVNKVWMDEENQDGIRPAIVYVVLYADGIVKDRVELTDENGWAYTWEDLDEMSAGKAITYTVKEEMPEGVKGYESEITGSAEEGFIITNTHEPETVNVTGIKTWNDGNDQDGIRPEAVTVNIYAEKLFGDKLVDTITVVPDADGNWNYTSKDLPKYAAGKEIKYIVEEVPVEGYETVVSGTNIVNTHTPEVINISGEKEWDDANNQDGKRPESITINLLANGNAAGSMVITEANGWNWTFENVPKYKDGVEIVYTITETVSNGYTAVSDGYDVTNSYTPGKTNVMVTKVWDDANNQDGKRPNAISVQLLANETEVEGKILELNDSNNWSASFTDLDEYANGVLIDYSVEEIGVPSGYESVVSGNAEDGYIITNSYEPETVDITGTKSWNDEDNQDGKRPVTLEITLNANGKPIDTQVISEETDWKWSFENLPKYANGTQIVYNVAETLPEGYSETNTPEGITNSYTPEKTSVKITKYWADNSDQDGIRPESVTMELTADGKSTGRSVELNAENKWTATIDDLDKYKDGHTITYGFSESEVRGYESYISGDMTSGFTAINTHTPETVTVDGEKIWRDKGDQDGLRPEAITINLLADGKKIKEVTVTEESGWNWMFDNLPKYKDHGTEIKYAVVEHQISNYDTTINNVKHDVTNTHIPYKTTVTVAKKWNDSDDQDGIRPDSIIVRLYADGNDTGKSLKLDESNKWVGTFNDLDEFAAGKKIKYTVSEDAIEGYSTIITGKDTKYITVTNTHEPETIDISGSKTWDDADDQDGIRPKSIKVNLFADGVAVDHKIVTAENGWKWKFEDVDKFDSGREIIYSVKEEPIEGYVASYDGMNIKNTHEPEKTEATVTKVWDDADDQDGIRPESLIVTLSNGDTVTLNEANNWTATVKELPKYADGEEITYSWTEASVEGYELTDTTKDGTVTTLTNTHTPEETEATVKKVWDDVDNQDGKRPAELTVILNNGTEDIGTVTLNEDNNWTATVGNLPKFAAGKELVYVWAEGEMPEGYELTATSSEGTVTTLTNSYKPEVKEATVTKIWEDTDNQDGKRPESLTVTLSNGTEVVLDEANDWTATVENLPVYEAGELIEYTWTEADAENYELTATAENGTITLLTNSHVPETTELTVYKNWKDKHDKYDKRPEEITVYLEADGEIVQTVQLNEADKWRYTFSDLPVYADGEEIIYTISEEPVEGYITEIDDMVITNTIDPEELDDFADTGDDSKPWAYGFAGLMAMLTAAGTFFFRRKED